MKTVFVKTHSSHEATAKVYMTSSINAEGLMKVYEALGKKAAGKTAVKISSGEPGGHHFLSPQLIAPLVKEADGTIVECNTAYGGRRADTESHKKVMAEHGFAAIAPIDIMDEDGDMSLKVNGGTHLKENYVGSHLSQYDFLINLAHFKGHAMGGFGGVLKNMSIGIASAMGKSWIHSAGKEKTGFGLDTPQDDFLESMAEAAKSIVEYVGDNILYINVMNNLSVDCDCDSHPAKPEMEDIGIFASLDPVALDQACVDQVYAAGDGKALIERMESRHGIHTVEHGEKIGIGTRNYELISVDE
ncbi:MAG: DUF362 domain-containing protein [Lachnospiraceae bacterium]|nr:DUF362 domain-containing protein [Lachnospiraceae bacterium]